MLHRATMRRHYDYVKKKYNCLTEYIDHNKYHDLIESIFKKTKTVYFYDPVDHIVIREMKKLSKRLNTKIISIDTPLFISKLKELEEFANKNSKKYNHRSFYIWQRKRFNILMNKNGKPIGGKYSFDVENRKTFPANFVSNNKTNHIPKIYNTENKSTNKYINEAKKYVLKYFSDNPGSTDFYLPIDYKEAKKHFNNFLQNRLKCFGPYQDAVDKNIPFGCHSIISPLLNIGLLTPNYVINKLLTYDESKFLYSLEAIIRQIIGWREYVRMLYIFERKQLEDKNYFNHKKKIKKYWFDAKNINEKTHIPPIDDMINKTIKFGYLHHIERLMYIGNFMLLNEIHPDESFKWFMEMFVDSYQWVMYPNVYGMSQHSSGPIMMGRPYFSSSNYIDKMSNYKKKKNVYNKIKIGTDHIEWFIVWDSLYYNFIANNIKILEKNYSSVRQTKHWNNKNKSEKKIIKMVARRYMKLY
jgi:deoxyribodipyrimidine photolyase-related protein